MIEQYNCFILNAKSSIKTLVLFFPFLDDNTIIEYNSHNKYKSFDFIKKYLNTYERNNVSSNEIYPEIIYSNFPLMVTDKIETFQYAVLKALNVINDVLLEELYLYAMTPIKNDQPLLFSKLTDDEYITKSVLMKFLSNVEYPKTKSLLKSSNSEIYNYDSFAKLDLLKDIKREKIPITIINKDITYVNPFKALEQIASKEDMNNFNKEAETNNNKSLYVANRNIQDFIHTEDNNTLSFYGCFLETILKDAIPRVNSLIIQYYPSIANVRTYDELIVYRDSNNTNDKNRKTIIQSLFESKTILTKYAPSSFKQWKSNFLKQTTFKNIRLEFQPNKQMFISLDTLFHAIDLNEETTLIKYNMGARLEKYFRIYLPNTNIRKTFIQKINNELSRAKKRSISCLLDVRYKSTTVPMIIEIRENGYIYVSLQNNVVMEDKIYDDNTITLDDIDYLLNNTYNKFIDYINDYYHQYETLLPKYTSLYNPNLHIVEINITKRYKIKMNKNLFQNINNYSSTIKNIFENIDSKQNSFIKFIFKHTNIKYNNKIELLFRRSVLKDKSFETVVDNIYHFDLLMPIYFMFDNLLHISEEKINIQQHSIVLNNSNNTNNNIDIKMDNNSIMSEKNELELLTEQFENNNQENNNFQTNINNSNKNIITNKQINTSVDNKQNSVNVIKENDQNNAKVDTTNDKVAKVNAQPKTLLGLRKKVDSNSNNDFFGGSTTPNIVNEKRNYTFERIKQYDANLVKKEKEKGRDYSRYCPSTDRRQPTIITESEKREIDEETPGSYGNEEAHSLKYRKRDGENLYYICPRYWCIDRNISLRHEDVINENGKLSSSKCPNGEIISYDHSLYHYRKNDKTKYVNTYPGLNLKKSNIPCCFKKPRKDSPQMNSQQNDIITRVNANKNILVAKETNVQQAIEDVHKDNKNIRILEYNKFPLPEFRYGILPLNIKLMLDVKNNDCMNDKTNCYLRFGTFNNDNNSFLQAMNIYYNFKSDSKRITGKLKSQITNTNVFLDTIVNDWLNIDEFIYYQNGNLLEIFDYQDNINSNITENNEKIITNTIFLKTITDKNGNIDQNMKNKIIRSYNNYKVYLKNGLFDYRYTWELFTNKINQKDKTKTNIVIIEIDGFEVESPSRIICPFAYSKDLRFDPNKQTLILIKYKDYFEPLIQRSRSGESKYYNKILFTLNDEILKPFLEKMENIYNNDEFCGKYMVNKDYINSYNNFLQISVAQMQEFFHKNKFTVKTYVVNYNSRLCGFVVTNKQINAQSDQDFYIPIHQTGIDAIRQLKQRNYTLINYISEYQDLHTTLRNFNFIHELENELHYKPKYFVCEDDYVVGIQCENTLIVPILPQIPKSIIENELQLDCIENSYIYLDNNNIQHYDSKMSQSNGDIKNSERPKILEDIISTTELYNVYRNHIRSNLNHVEYRDIKNQINSLIVQRTNDKYSQNMELIIQLIKLLANKNGNKISNNIKQLNDTFAYLLSDELLRHYRIRDYMFVDNKYILFGEKKRSPKENEFLIAQSSLDNLNEELLELNKKDEITTYDTTDVETNIALKYDDGFDILNYVPKEQHKLLKKTDKTDNTNDINKSNAISKISKDNVKIKTIKKREKCPNGTRKNKKTGLCEDK